jgi:hypothetical protein
VHLRFDASVVSCDHTNGSGLHGINKQGLLRSWKSYNTSPVHHLACFAASTASECDLRFRYRIAWLYEKDTQRVKSYSEKRALRLLDQGEAHPEEWLNSLCPSQGIREPLLSTSFRAATHCLTGNLALSASTSSFPPTLHWSVLQGCKVTHLLCSRRSTWHSLERKRKMFHEVTRERSLSPLYTDRLLHVSRGGDRGTVFELSSTTCIAPTNRPSVP